MYVQDVMSYDAEACGPDSTLADAARVMWERDCGVVPVVDAERRVVGVITDRDICMAVMLRDRRASEVRVGEVMSQPVHTCTPVDDVREALETMSREQVRRLPVVNAEGRLAGILSQGDVVLRSERGKSKKHVSNRVTMRALKAVSRPHGAGQEDGKEKGGGQAEAGADDTPPPGSTVTG